MRHDESHDEILYWTDERDFSRDIRLVVLKEYFSTALLVSLFDELCSAYAFNPVITDFLSLNSSLQVLISLNNGQSFISSPITIYATTCVSTQ